MRLLLCLVLVAACRDDPAGDSGIVVPTGPVLSHELPGDTLGEGDSVTLTVQASDPDGVAQVVLYYRTEGLAAWDAATLEEGDGGWQVTVDELRADGLEYYFKGSDLQGAASYLPAGGAGAPFQLPVHPATLPLPFLEDFDPGDGVETLLALGWWNPSDTATSYPWTLTLAQGLEGTAGATHPRGYEGMPEVSDWLISPALDFSAVSSAMVTWQEAGNLTELARHGLYISTTERLPEDGGYEAVALPLDAPPEDEWGRSVAVDLSAWAGAHLVYLAWNYSGSYADVWSIDDVRVTELQPDLVAELRWAPDPLSPGDTVDLVVSLGNLTEVDADEVVASLQLPDGGGSLTVDTVSVGRVAGLGSAEVGFELVLDEGLAANRYLPLLLTLTDGTLSWDFELSLTVGLPSEAAVEISLDEAATVEVVVGVGDPGAPTASLTVQAGTLEAGSHSMVADVTDLFDYLPAGPGDNRWFASVEATSAGSIDAFGVTWGGEATRATVLADLVASQAAVVYAPEPPSPALESALTTPAELAPGDDVTLTVTLRNLGEDTSGPVTATLTSDEVSVLSTEPVSLDGDLWETGESNTLAGLRFIVPDDHTSSSPVDLALELTDGVEAWTVDVALDVDWPVMRLLSVVVVDSDFGDDDGVLDPDETAGLAIAVVNTGDLDSFGVVYGTLSFAPTSTATAATAGDVVRFGSMTSGGDRDEEFEVSVTGGADGDTLDLVLSLYDDSATYEVTTQLVLGEPSWIALSTRDDDLGDTLEDYPFDFVNARYRVVDGMVQLAIESAVPYDPGTLFIEAWGRSSGAGYTYYRWVLQAGVTSMQGYTSTEGFTDIGDPDVVFSSDTELVLSWELEPMAMARDSFSIGLASGWCGPPDYYCDHFPNGWGYPYATWDTGRWYDVEW